MRVGTVRSEVFTTRIRAQIKSYLLDFVIFLPTTVTIHLFQSLDCKKRLSEEYVQISGRFQQTKVVVTAVASREMSSTTA
uniref:PHB domain-containing protein n=1 Tax=Steinernema glaseri TaxID=37863 RepID=A0A1I8A9T5_9BILA